MTTQVIPSQKHLFDLSEEVTYLNCSYMSPQLLSVTEAGRKALQRKTNPWKIIPKDFFEETEKTRGLFAELIESDINDVAFVPSTSYGLAVAAKNLLVRPESKILLLAEQFPSNVLVWQDLAEKHGAKILFIHDPEKSGWTEKVLSVLDEQTSIVALEQAHWTDGRMLDLDTIGKRCREIGVPLVLDLTQTLGAVPFSTQNIQPDFMIAATYKWLLGPYSMGFLYVHPKHQQGHPIEYNWINRKKSEDFNSLVKYEPEFKKGARRYDVGQHSNFMLMPMVKAALKQILEWEVPNISATLKELTQFVAQHGIELGLLCPDSSQRAPHFLGLGFPGGIPEGLIEDLNQEHIYVSVRGSFMRISPHLYNSRNDVELLFSLLLQRI